MTPSIKVSHVQHFLLRLRALAPRPTSTPLHQARLQRSSSQTTRDSHQHLTLGKVHLCLGELMQRRAMLCAARADDEALQLHAREVLRGVAVIGNDDEGHHHIERLRWVVATRFEVQGEQGIRRGHHKSAPNDGRDRGELLQRVRIGDVACVRVDEQPKTNDECVDVVVEAKVPYNYKVIQFHDKKRGI